jgi:putative spermidine/putrescine transport system permease protein
VAVVTLPTPLDPLPATGVAAGQPATPAGPTKRRWYSRIVPNMVLILCALFFLAPLITLARYSLQNVPTILLGWSTLFDKWHPMDPFKAFQEPGFTDALWLTVQLAIGTVVLTLALLIPTAVWVHLRIPKARGLVEFLTVLPYMIPPIAMVAGIRVIQPHARWFLDSDFSLIPFYVVLALPFSYRSLDAGLRAIDLRTLVDASRSLGAGWTRTLIRTVIPNLRTAIIAASFLTAAIVIGEFTIARILITHTLPDFQFDYARREPRIGYGLNLLVILVTVGLFLVISLSTRKRATPRRSYPLTSSTASTSSPS